MSQPDQDADLITVLGRLLADPTLRARLRANPAETARALSADEAVQVAVRELNIDQLEEQAAGLINKRLAEVRQRLPDSFADNESVLVERFRQYAASNWPTGHRRHGRDAVEFGRYLLDNDASLLQRGEWHWLCFQQSTRRFAVHWLRGWTINGRRRPALQILVRWRHPHQWVVFLR